MSKFTGQDYHKSEVLLRAGRVQNNTWVNRILGSRSRLVTKRIDSSGSRRLNKQ